MAGNIRQLKNITEQISIIEEKRVISAEMLKSYLDGAEASNLPVLSKKEIMKILLLKEKYFIRFCLI